MSRLFTRLRRGGRGVIVAAAASAALVSGVVAGASAASASVNCQWQPLSLQNGWHSEQSAWNSGDPAYCIDNGIVYVSGSLAQSRGSSGTYFAQLPQQYRPASNMYLTVYTYAGTAGGVVRIDTDGTMHAYGGAATSFTSLAGISFPAAWTAEQPITLDPHWGWQSADSQWGTGNPSYHVSDGVVHLSGSVFNPGGGGSASNLGVLPSAAWPAADTLPTVYTYGGTVGNLNIFTEGSIGATYTGLGGTEANSTAFTSLAGVTYPAAGSAETPLPLLNGWQSGQPPTWPSHAMSYYISNGVVYLDGQVTNTGSGKVAVLPPAARPTHTLYLTVSINWFATAILQINPDGSMYTYGGPPSNYNNPNDYTNFSGISFEAGE